MYGLSDHLKPMPLTAFSALRQGCSRYSARATCEILEHTFAKRAQPNARFLRGSRGRRYTTAKKGAKGEGGPPFPRKHGSPRHWLNWRATLDDEQPPSTGAPAAGAF